MIKKLEAKDIVKLNHIDLPNLPCEKGQYIQFLMSRIEDPKMLIIGDVENDALKSYGVFVDNRLPPIFNNAVVIGIWTLNHKDTIELIKAANEWAKKIGIETGIVSVPDNDKHNEKYMESLGGKKVAVIYEWEVE